jgi:uncharacterized protein YegP (UPF0339 family)
MKFQMYKDTTSQFRWRLKNNDGRTIATSAEGYLQREDCLNAIRLVRHSGLAELEDLAWAAA